MDVATGQRAVWQLGRSKSCANGISCEMKLEDERSEDESEHTT
jgi:hypothetical protein